MQRFSSHLNKTAQNTLQIIGNGFITRKRIFVQSFVSTVIDCFKVPNMMEVGSWGVVDSGNLLSGTEMRKKIQKSSTKRRTTENYRK